MSEEDDKSPIYFERDREQLLLGLVEKLNTKVDENYKKTQQTIEFIVDQQAKFATDLQQMHETHVEEIKEIREVVARLATASLNRLTDLENKTTASESDFDAKMAALVDAQLKTEATVSDLSVKMEALVDAHIKTESTVSQIDAKMSALADAQAKTEAATNASAERLNSFIATVDRLLNETRGGNSQN